MRAGQAADCCGKPEDAYPAYGLADVNQLEPVEHLLERLYQSVYYQRLQATDRCMEGLYDLTRRIRDFAETYPEVAEEGQPLLDFMKAFKPGRKKEKKESGEGEG
uniref:hypothetical protein n=1 Tax=Candidatus Electronema sp. TaxID=2698783 RepID=UPI0040574FEF